MQAIVLAGGRGTRLADTVPGLPKPLAPINGRPFLTLLLDLLAKKKFEVVVLSVGFMWEAIKECVGENYGGMAIRYAVETEPLGTGGGVRLAMTQVSSDHAFVFNGDTFFDVNTEQMEKLWMVTRRPLIVGCTVDDTQAFGRLVTKEGVVTEYHEKGQSGPGLVSAGCYLLAKSQLEHFAVGTAFSLEREFMPSAVHNREFDIYEVEHHRFLDIGTPALYEEAQQKL